MKLAGAYINDDTYERLVALAVSNNRTLAGQCRHLFDRALKGELSVPDAPTAKTQPAAASAAAQAQPLAGRGRYGRSYGGMTSPPTPPLTTTAGGPPP